MGKKLTQEEFIKRAINCHGNRFEYDSAIYESNNKKIIIFCKIHGYFEQYPQTHMSGGKCKKCAREENARRISLTTEEFIERAIDIHGEEFNYSKSNYLNNSTEIEIICSKHGSFWQTPHTHLSGKSKCPECGKMSRGANNPRKLSLQQFIDYSNKKHQYKYDYNKSIFITVDDKIEIICNKENHGSFWQTPCNHMRGQGCPPCKYEKISKLRCNTTEEFIKEASIKHENYYIYSKVKYIKNNIKVEIICPKHKSFWQTPLNHLNNSGCRECGYDYISDILSYSTEEFINMAKKLHKNKYKYDKVNYIDCNTKIVINCSKHGDFEQSPSSHLRGHGCIKCSCSISKAEIEWLDSLNIKIRQYRIKINNKLYKVDGFDPITNTIYEFDGDFWHGNPEFYNAGIEHPVSYKKFGELYDQTICKKQTLELAGYKVISIWHSEYLKIKKYNELII